MWDVLEDGLQRGSQEGDADRGWCPQGSAASSPVLVSMHCDTVLAWVLRPLPNSSQPAALEHLPARPQPHGHCSRGGSPASAGTLRLGLGTPAVARSVRDPGARMPCSFTEEHPGPRSCLCARRREGEAQAAVLPELSP